MTFKELKKETLSNNNLWFLLSYTGEEPKDYIEEVELDSIEDLPLALTDYQYGYIYIYQDRDALVQEIYRLVQELDLTAGSDDQYYDYNPDTYQMVITGAIYAGIWDDIKPLMEEKLRIYQGALLTGDVEEIEEYSDINEAIDNAHHYIEAII